MKKQKNNDKIKNNHNTLLIRIPYTHFNELYLEDLLLKTSKYILEESYAK